MNQQIIINGIPIQLENPDLDGDGKKGGVETLSSSSINRIPATETTELGDALHEMNKDEVNTDRLPSIDFLAEIHDAQMIPMVVFDALIGMGLVPQECGVLSRVMMRKSVSSNRKGRDEFVKLVVGKREEENDGIGNKFKNLFGGAKKE